MKQFIILYTAALAALGGFAQNNLDYAIFSEMNGMFTLDDGSEEGLELPFWGFGDDYKFFTGVTLPGPPIYATEGDSVFITLRNPSMEGHTIHLHGLDVDQENDGVPGTSDFVLGGEQRTYAFKATHAGNFLYHCHVTTTMHLALGMYSYVIVYPADDSNRVYTGGPHFEREYVIYGSDLDSRWNTDYTSIGDFKSYAPDFLLINGKCRRDIYNDSSMVVAGEVGDTVFLRLMNVGYKVHRYLFPATLEALAVTSDGRPLPSPMSFQELDVNPGERYGILARVLSTDTSLITIEMRDAYKDRLLRREFIPVNHYDFNFTDSIPDDTGSVEGIRLASRPGEHLRIWPNPAIHAVTLQADIPLSDLVLRDGRGRLIRELKGRLEPREIFPMELQTLPSGVYLIEAQNIFGQKITTKLQKL